MPLNEDTIDVEKPDRKCSLTLVLDQYLGLFLHPSNVSIMHSRSA